MIKKIEQLKDKMHHVLDEMACAINPNYSFSICIKYQKMCDNEIDKWFKLTDKENNLLKYAKSKSLQRTKNNGGCNKNEKEN